MSEATSENDKKRKTILGSFLPDTPLQWVGVVGAIGIVAAIGGLGALLSGMGPLSAVPPHPDGWAHLLHFASTRVLAHNASSAPPSAEPLDNHAVIMHGAAEYALVCADCHGAPGFGQNPVALSTRPEPPMLVDISKKLSDGELYYVVKNGVRYTAMPAWPVQNRPDEIWAMVAFIKAMPTMDSSTYLRLATGSGDGSLPKRDANANAALTTAQGNPKSISPFVAANNENRPYLPGDPQESSFSSPAATVLPRTGYVSIDRSDLVSACVTCHGSENTGRPGGPFPNLTLQSPQYIYDSLHAFASGQRQSGIMWLVAGNLSDDQMRSLALQIGASPARASRADTEDVNATAMTTAHGDDIAHAGIGGPAGAERCTSCHVPGPEVDKIIPAIDGQNAAYFRAQMRLFRAGGRGDTTSYNPMIDESKNLSDADIAALADYYAAAPPRPKH